MGGEEVGVSGCFLSFSEKKKQTDGLISSQFGESEGRIRCLICRVKFNSELHLPCMQKSPK